MSTTVDNRIVEMQFDNSNFEKNVKTSMSTIDKLKKALKFDDSVKSLDNLEKKAGDVSFGGLASGIEAVTNKISALEVVGITAIARYTDKIIDSGERLVKSLSIDQVTAGWSKYEQKTANVQTLMNATGLSIDEVNGYLKKLMQFSDETSYGFTDMTAALGQMAASGGDVEKLVPLITGVANATAYAGKGAAEFSRVMYNLNQSYGAGSLQLMDWKSVELAGVASKQLKEELIAAAEELGTIKEGEVTLANFNETLRKKWATTEVMERAFGRFAEFSNAVLEAVDAKKYETASDAIAAMAGDYDELGVTAFKAAQEAKSFSEAIDATKDAVSSGWLQTFEIIFGNYEEAKVLWTDLANVLWDMFASGAEGRNEFIEKVMGEQYVAATTSQWTKFANSISLSADELSTFQKALKGTAREHGVYVDEILNTIEEATGQTPEFADSMIQSWLSYDILSETVTKFADACNTTDAAVRELSRAELKNLGYTEDQIDAIGEWAKTAEEAGTPLYELLDIIDRPPGRDLLIESFFNILEAINTVIGQIKKSWQNVFPKLTENRVYDLILAFTKLTRKLIPNKEALDKINRALTGVFSVVKLLTDIVGSAFKFAWESIKAVFEALDIDILELAARFGDALKSFTEWIRTNNKFNLSIDKVRDGIKKFIDNLKRLYEEFRAIPEVQEKMDSFGTKSEQVLSKLIGWLKDAKDAVVSFFGSFKSLDDIHAEDIVNAFKRIKQTIERVLPSLKPNINLGDNVFVKAIDNIRTGAETAAVNIGKAFNFIGDVLADARRRIEDSSIAGNALVIMLGVLVLKVTDMISSVVVTAVKVIKAAADLLTGAANILLSISGIGKQISKAIADQRTIAKIRAYADLSIQLAEALLIMVGLWVAISHLMKQENMLEAAAVLGGFMLALGALALIIGVASKIAGSDTGGLYSSILSITAGLSILVVAFGWLTKNIDPKGIDAAIKGMIACVISLGVLAVTISFVSKNLSAAMPGLISISLALAAFVAAFYVMTLVDPAKIGNSIALMVIALGGLIGLAISSKNVTDKAGESLLKMAASLAVLAIVLKIFSVMKIETLLLGIAKLIPVIVLVLGSMALISRLAGSEQKTGVASVILSMAAGLIAIALAMRILEPVDWKKLLVSALAMSIVIAAFAVPLLAIREMGQYAYMATPVVIVMAGALLALSIALIGLSFIPWDRLLHSIIAMGVLFVGLTSVVKSTAKIQSWSSTGALAAMVVLVATLGLVIASIAAIPDINKAETAVYGISALLISLGVTLKLVNGGSFNIGVVGMLVALTGIVALLACIIAELANNVENANGAIGCVAAILLALAGMTAILEVINKFPINNTIAVFKSLITILGSIGLIVVLLGGLGWLLNTWGQDIISGLETMGEVFRLLGNLLGQFAGGVAGGFDSGRAKTIFKTFENLEISEKAQKNIESFTGVVGTMVDLAAKVPSVGGLVSKITGDNSLETLGIEFNKFAHSILEASSIAVSDYSLKAIKGCCEVAAEMVKIVPKDMSVSFQTIITGVRSLSKLGREVNDFSYSIDNMASVKDRDIKNAKKLAECGESLMTFVNGIRNTGGLTSLINGDLHLGSIGQQLFSFAKAIDGIDDYDISVESMALIGEAGEAIATFINSMPNTGGVIKEWFTGDIHMDELGRQLVEFGKAMMDFSGATDGLTKSKIAGPVAAGELIAKLEKDLPQSGGKIQEFFGGQQSLGNFATNIEAFGKAIRKFYDKTYEIEPSKISNVADSTKSMVTISTELSKITTNIFTGSMDLDIFATQLEAFGYGFKEFADTVLKINTIKTNAVIESISKMMGILSGIDSYGGNIQDAAGFADLMSSIAESGVEYFVDVFMDCDVVVSQAIAHLFEVVTNSTRTSFLLVKLLMTKTADDTIRMLRDRRSDFESAGSYVVSGFIAGMRSRIRDVEIAAEEMARSAPSAARRVLAINSPSRVFKEIGSFCGIGFVNSLRAFKQDSEKSGAALGDSAASGLSYAMARIKEIIETDDSLVPVITPVIDSSNIRGTMSAINGYMNQNASVNLGAINGQMNHLNAMANSITVDSDQSMSDVVDAINSLKDDFKTMQSAITNMKMVVDSGALIGQISGGMDAALGNRSMRAARERI